MNSQRNSGASSPDEKIGNTSNRISECIEEMCTEASDKQFCSAENLKTEKDHEDAKRKERKMAKSIIPYASLTSLRSQLAKNLSEPEPIVVGGGDETESMNNSNSSLRQAKRNCIAQLLRSTPRSTATTNLHPNLRPQVHEGPRVGAISVDGIGLSTNTGTWDSQYIPDSVIQERESSRALYSQTNSFRGERAPVSAILVNDEQLEANMTHRIISNAVQADVVTSQADVVMTSPTKNKWSEKKHLIVFVLFVGIVVGVLTGLLVRRYKNSGNATNLPTIEAVIKRGVLCCSIGDVTGFGTLNHTTNEAKGLTADLCRAVAATVLGDPNKVEFVTVNTQQRFQFLGNKKIDLLANTDTITLERDVREATSGLGFSFSIPYFYDGLRFAGIKNFVECADATSYTGKKCKDLKICVLKASTHQDIISPMFPEGRIMLQETHISLLEGLSRGACNVVAGEQSFIGEYAIQQIGYTGEYIMGSKMLSREPLALVTRDDDQQWTNIVNGVMEVLLLAEEQNITKALFGRSKYMPNNSSTLDSRFWRAIESVGNYGEIYERNLEHILPRKGLNELYNQHNNASTGLLYSYPFGNTLEVGPGPISGGTMEKILTRGILRCGVIDLVGFAQYDFDSQEWSGLNIDYCRAIALSIFAGVDIGSKLDIVSLSSVEREVFSFLSNGTIDILAGTNFQLEHDLFEYSSDTTSTIGFAFSTPYYYNELYFGNLSKFQDCVGKLQYRDCSNLKICVQAESIHYLHLKTLVDSTLMVPVEYLTLNGACNAIAGSKADVENATFHEDRAVDAGYASKYTLSLVTRGDDSQWSAFVDWIVMSTIYAEEEGIGQSSANSMPLVKFFGEKFERMFRDAIAFVGNYQEMYNRSVRDHIPRHGRNLLNAEPTNFKSLHGAQHHSRLFFIKSGPD